jgi:2-dehydropantoate 2-reductase
VLNTAAAAVHVGELDGRTSARAERLAAVLDKAGLPSTCVPDIRTREWNKLTLYLSLALVSAITRIDTVTMVFDPDLNKVCVQVALESAAVAEAEGLPLSLSRAGCSDLIETFSRPIRTAGMVHYMSLTQDLMAARPTELEATAGDVLARAARHSLTVPTVEACTNILRGVERSSSQAQSIAAR